MLFYPSDLETKLEIDQIRELVQGFCKTEVAKKKALEVKPITDFEKLSNVLIQVSELMAYKRSGHTLPSSHDITDIRPFLKKVRTSGTFLEAESLSEFRAALKSIYEWTQFIKKHPVELASLVKMTIGFIADRQLVDGINEKLDEKGDLRDNASPELVKIRKSIYAAEMQVRTSIRKILERSKTDEYSDHEGSVTIRGGRLVIPIKAEHKRRFQGFIHDESASGQTVFMEPAEVLEQNNLVKELQFREKREIIRILTELADKIRDAIDDLVRGCEFLIKLDFILAKTQYGCDFDCQVPFLQKTPSSTIYNGRHPLLWSKLKKEGKQVVPVNLTLDQDNRILLISGPNAGGKSVALKTIGALQYTFQSGFPVPVDAHSKLGIYRNFFIEIGDSQSLENDLSTYSSHLKAMRYFTSFGDRHTLLLLDEFGSGTDPQFGGPISEAVLKKFVTLKCKGVITTHYSILKVFAESAEGLTNAAMKYDVKKLSPLYQLEIGKPGSSFALEIAAKMGLGNDIMVEAKKGIGGGKVHYDAMLNKLSSEKLEFEKKQKQLDKETKDLIQLKKDYEAIKKLVQEEKKDIIKAAKSEAKTILSDANKKIEKTIRDIKEAKAEKTVTRKIRKELKEFDKQLDQELQKENRKKENVCPNPNKTNGIKIGDHVKMIGSGSIGKVVAMKGKQLEVSIGMLKSYVSRSKVEKAPNQPLEIKPTLQSRKLNFADEIRSFSRELDLRGKRGEEVLPLVDKMIDTALLAGSRELKIIHGKGHGILKNLIRNHLKKEPTVLGMEDDHADRGGSGITVVTLR